MMYSSFATVPRISYQNCNCMAGNIIVNYAKIKENNQNTY